MAETIDGMVDERSDATKLQDRIIEGALRSLAKKRDAFLNGPTGCGKSRMFSEIAAARVDEGDHVLVLSHRQNLVTQGQENMEKWVKRPITTSIGMNGHIDQSGQVVYSTVQTAHELRDQLVGYKTAVVDEAHHVTSENREYLETIQALIKQNPGIRFVPASATPPEKYEGLHPRFQKADKHVITFEEAVKAKLVRLPVTKCPAMIYTTHERVDQMVAAHRKDDKSADMLGGINKALTRMRGPDHEDWAVQTMNQYERHLATKRTLAYFDSIREANFFIAEALKRNIAIAAIHSGQSMADNDSLREAFKQRRLVGLASVDMISEGYDIDCNGILLDKKTTSATEYKQILGRGSRGHGADGEPTLLIDQGASTYIHGDIGVQAQMQTLRGGLERKTTARNDLLPDAQTTGFRPWVEVKIPGGNRTVWGTSVDGAIVYACPTKGGYAAFASSKDRKGQRVDLLQIEGQRKGMPSRKALGDWIADAVQRNERALARLAGQSKGGMSELERMIGTDWERNARSIERSIDMLVAHSAAAQSAQPSLRQASR